MSTAEFYDGLADTYHALYADWRKAARSRRRLCTSCCPAGTASLAAGLESVDWHMPRESGFFQPGPSLG